MAPVYIAQASAVLTFCTSAMYAMPSSPKLLFSKLHTTVQVGCQRLLTVCRIRQVWAGGVLERHQRRVDFERIGQLDDAFGSVGARCTAEEAARDTTQRVAGEAADEGRAQSVSGC